MRRAVLGTATAAGLALLGGGTAGVLALDGSVRAAERPAAPRNDRFVRDLLGPCQPPALPHRAPARSTARNVKL